MNPEGPGASRYDQQVLSILSPLLCMCEHLALELRDLPVCIVQVLVLFYFLKQGLYIVLAVLWDSLFRPDWSRTHKDLPASAFQELVLKAYTTTSGPGKHFF